MSLNLYKVHKYREVQTSRGRMQVIDKVDPYIRFRVKDFPPIFCQGGRLYYSGGEAVKDIPDWFWAEAEKINEAGRAKCGLDKVLDAHHGVKEPEPDPEVDMEALKAQLRAEIEAEQQIEAGPEEPAPAPVRRKKRQTRQKRTTRRARVSSTEAVPDSEEQPDGRSG